MTPLQRQAVLVCVVCALAALLTIGITLTLLRRGKVDAPNVPDADSVSSETPADGDDLSEHYQIDNSSASLLAETADARGSPTRTRPSSSATPTRCACTTTA